jgi:hypothetical protein
MPIVEKRLPIDRILNFAADLHILSRREARSDSGESRADDQDRCSMVVSINAAVGL